jgi:metallo-beta-lactamase class B
MRMKPAVLGCFVAILATTPFLAAQQPPPATPSDAPATAPKVWTAGELFRRNIGSTQEQRTQFPPHKIVGNIYYVGTGSLSAFLIVTPEGNILIDSTYESNVPIIKDSIEKLGFKFEDIKVLLGSHAHGDHQEADAMIVEMTKAMAYAMADDIPALKTMRTPSGKPRPEYVPLKHLEEVKFGGMTLVAHLTPGHTRGCTTWTMKVEENGKTHDVVIIGSMGINSDTTRMWADGKLTPLGEEYARGFKAMHEIKADVVLGSHPAMHGMTEKYAKLKAGGPTNPYIDPNGYQIELGLEEGAYKLIIENQQKAEAAAKAAGAGSSAGGRGN